MGGRELWETTRDCIATFRYASEVGCMTPHSSSLLSTLRFWPFHQRYLQPKGQNQNYMPKCKNTHTHAHTQTETQTHTHTHKKKTSREDRHVDSTSTGEAQSRTVQTGRHRHAGKSEIQIKSSVQNGEPDTPHAVCSM